MTTTTTLKAVRRMALEGYLQALRLPLTAVERLAGQTSNEQWPPALAYEGFEANVETLLGSLLRDPSLVDKGRLRQAKLAQLRTATELETLAEQEREQADRTLASRQETAEQQRADAQARAEQRKQELERQAAVRERKAEAKAAKKTAAIRARKADRDKTVDRHERIARTEALSAESRALSVAKEALDADRTIDVIDDTIEGTKAARKTS